MPLNTDKRSTTRLTCAQHCVPYLKHELEQLGFDTQDEHPTGIDTGASLADAMRLALTLRTATHTMWQLKRFRCTSPKALYTEIAAFPWEEIIPEGGYLTIRAASDTPTIDNQMYPALVCKDAICDRMLKKTGRRPDAGPDRTGVCLNLYWKADRAQIFLNLNGSPLSNRGYRRLPHNAPMRETLAASVLLAMGYDGTAPLINPMCGSGTLAIEAALIAANRAPGLLRSDYAILKTALPITDLWKQARAEAKLLSPLPRAGEGRGEGLQDPPLITATDHDPQAIDAAQKNAKVAGVDHLIRFAVEPFIDTQLPDEPGHIVLNPEYGQRLGVTEELEDTYADMGDFFKQHAAGWRCHVFTGSRELAKRIGLRPTSRKPFFNGPIECRLLSFEIYSGSKG